MEKVKKEPFPFEKIAVAFAFSPRLEAILNEAYRYCTDFDSELLLVHVGEPSSEEKLQLDNLLKKSGLPPDRIKVIWRKGDPVTEILSVCRENRVDLLILGALEKENLLEFFTGSIGRDICRKAKCSVLLLTSPSTKGRTYNRLVVSAMDNPKTEYSIRTSVYFSRVTGVNEVVIIEESQLSNIASLLSEEQSDMDLARIRSLYFREQKEMIKETLAGEDIKDIRVKLKRTGGKPGFSATDYARKEEADLLVFNSPDKNLGFIDRVFPYDLEYALADLPCDLLIVHSRPEL